MMRALTCLLVAASAAVLAVAPSAEASAKAHVYKNCTAMHKDYPHGVGRYGAHDKTSGKPVTNFHRSDSLYRANKKSDRDKDGIACEAA